MSSAHPQHWQGDLKQLREASPEELFQAPLFVVVHDNLPSLSFKREARKRTAEVGKAVARMLNGTFVQEGELPVFNGVPEHFDGIVDRYLQVNTTYALDKKDPSAKDGGTRFVMRRRSAAPITIHDFFPRNHRQLFDTEYENSCRVYTPSRLDPIKPSIEQIAKAEDLAFPNTTHQWEVVVPLGATAVFLNGSDHRDIFYTHETSSWHTTDRPSNFLRVAELGRVVGNSIQTYEP